MNKRNDIRLEKNLLAYTDSEESDLLGVISNISKNGIFLVTDKNFDLNSEISFVLAVYNEIYYLKGEVRWIRSPENKIPEHLPTGIGIRITEAPAEYVNYVEIMRYKSQNSIFLTH